MGAEAALAVAQRSVDGGGAEPVIATTVRLDYAEFMTDRGPRTLPAWLVTIADATGPVALVAVDRPARFDGPLGFDRARIDTFGTQVTLNFVGAAEGTGSCTADYRLDVIEHHAFVETAVIETRHGDGDCSSVG